MNSIKVHNSLKPGPPVPFVPMEPGKVSWYACGPTVYDKSHLGHARNYVTSDIIRRIMMHYFGFNVKYVMNMTDVDDKIIIKARRQRLLDLEKKKKYSEEELRTLGLAAFRAYASKNLPLLANDASKLDETNYATQRDTAYGTVLSGGTLTGEGKPGDNEAKIKMHVSNMDAAAEALKQNAIFPGADEVLLPYLDSLHKETMDTSDQSIFTDLTKRMEAVFLEDMDNLNVLRPDVITRVTEYVPQIAKFVEQIVDKGFAYEAEGSVYFDIAAFQKAGNTYARLRPDSKNNKALQEEGEGSLSTNLGGKRGAGDFALWKKSKAGEPYWPSKWGDGRPGWHIECSVMASDVLGSRMDVHSGGVDLAFPHHDNELAQSEAYFCQHGKGEHTWVNYFLHMGHLSISGSKMSKSLKNFQTIADALATTYTARSMRIVFLMGRWNDGVEISPDMRSTADNWETTISNFFTNTKSWIREAGVGGGVRSLSINQDTPATGLLADLELAKKEVEAALTNSFDTPRAMLALLKLVNNVNTFVMNNKDVDLAHVEAIARWITKMVGIFGLDPNAIPPYDGLGWASSIAADIDPKKAIQPYVQVLQTVMTEVSKLSLSSDTLSNLLSQDPSKEFESIVSSGTRDIEELSLPYIRVVSQIRDELRRIVSSQTAENKKAILAIADRIRDVDLTNLGVSLDDRPDNQPSLIKFIPAAELIRAREEKAAREAEKAQKKEEARIAREKAEQEAKEKAKIPPEEMFKKDERYSAWDESGMPTKMKDGSDVPKSQLKSLKKMWEKQKKVHEEFKAKGGL
ncbi:cysteinyl-tRNA-synthetase [Metarhizium robertsii]|uniref:cysteine--tRNA ligase n=2 Tax=Metarhizium robertsii TaxID=568076 RepID=E9F214_METRA|nr:tRNA synthetase class I catalytic domain-containing protein [Metarhizium robertsii ARSEF 23]EFY98103.1 tRNA synthetase class I catalytic domain-containing protein [Metarhizium robertsii ARSEF 23]EXU97889.1 cysteinyl-tRNA-synthetase [Metarhizium robertsii]